MRVTSRPLATTQAALVAAASLACVATPARAQTVLYSQTPAPLSSLGAWNSSTTPTFSQGFLMADDFVLPGTQQWRVNQISWRGLYLDLSNTANNPPVPTTLLWQLQLYTSVSSGGQEFPAANPFIGLGLGSGVVSRTFVANAPFGGGPTAGVYDFSVSFQGSGIVLNGGQRYWLSLVSVQPSTDPVWGWLTSPDAGGAGRGLSYSQQYAYQTGGTTSYLGQRDNLAFAIGGTAVAPEPGTLALLGVPCIALSAFRIRPARRKSHHAT
jgi:hypothetical protein